jgi:Zn ribbon nucleic-acid-binding protein
MKKRSMSKRGRMMTVREFRALFGEEQLCGEQLSRQRWPVGFKCPRCSGPSRGYMAERQVHECALCAYRRLKQKGFEHTATAISKQNEPAHELFPWVHITLSNLKRFLLGTHHKVEQKHLKHYVAEFNYRLRRRNMEADLMVRLLRVCKCTQTITYKQLVAMPELA